MSATGAVAAVPPQHHICTPECLTVKCCMEEPLNAKNIALHAFNLTCPNGFNVIDVTMAVKILGKKTSYCCASVYFQKTNGQIYFNHEQSKEDIKLLLRKLPSTIEVTKGHSCLLDPCCYAIDFAVKCSCNHPFKLLTTKSAGVLTANKLVLRAMDIVGVIDKFISSGVPIVVIDYEVHRNHKCGYIGGLIIVLTDQAAFNIKTTHRIETGESISSRRRYASYVDLLRYYPSTSMQDFAHDFSKLIFGKYPVQSITYNCNPILHWKDIGGECSSPELLRTLEIVKVDEGGCQFLS